MYEVAVMLLNKKGEMVEWTSLVALKEHKSAVNYSHVLMHDFRKGGYCVVRARIRPSRLAKKEG